MDPNEVLKELRSLSADVLGGNVDAYRDAATELAAHAQNLDAWLVRGGFLPTDWETVRPAPPVRWSLTEELTAATQACAYCDEGFAPRMTETGIACCRACWYAGAWWAEKLELLFDALRARGVVGANTYYAAGGMWYLEIPMGLNGSYVWLGWDDQYDDRTAWIAEHGWGSPTEDDCEPAMLGEVESCTGRVAGCVYRGDRDTDQQEWIALPDAAVHPEGFGLENEPLNPVLAAENMADAIVDQLRLAAALLTGELDADWCVA